LDDWAPDGETMLYHWAEPRRVGAFDLTSRKKTDLLVHLTYNLYQPHFSLDGQWVTFLALTAPRHRRLYIVPFRGERPIPEALWIPITTGEYSDDKPRFSPNGNLLYFTSDRDGFMCLWAQPLEPQSKRPVGRPFAVHHFHNGRLSMQNLQIADLEISVAVDKIVFTLAELTGNIWMAELSPNR